jgi:hypothetical protein
MSVILLDWNSLESFQSLQHLNQQTIDRSKYELGDSAPATRWAT